MPNSDGTIRDILMEVCGTLNATNSQLLECRQEISGSFPSKEACDPKMPEPYIRRLLDDVLMLARASREHADVLRNELSPSCEKMGRAVAADWPETAPMDRRY